MALEIKETDLSPQFTSEQRKILRKLLTQVYDQVFIDVVGFLNLGDLGDVTITSVANQDIIRYDSGSGDWENVEYQHCFVIPLSNQLGTFGATTNASTFRMPFNFTITAITASLQTAQTSGNIVTVDMNVNGSSIMSTKLTIDNGEKTSTTAATPVVTNTSIIAEDAEVSFDIDQIGDSTAVGLVVNLIGYPS